MPDKVEALRFRCPKCRYKIKVAASLAGKAGKCPECLTALRVPGGEGESEPSAKERSSKERPKQRRRERSEGTERRVEEAPAGEDPICPACEEPHQVDATECASCGFQLACPGYVDTVFSVSGVGMIVFGILTGLNAVMIIVKAGFGALIPATIVGVVAVAMVRVGLGLRDKNKLSVGVAAFLGLLVMLVNVPMAMAALSGARIYLAPGVRLSAPVVLISLLLNLAIYFPPLVVGVRFRQAIDWT